jgi:DNA repair protein RadD
MHQLRSVSQVCERFSRGTKTLVLGAPTAAGKGLITTAMVNLVRSRGGRIIIYNLRKLLTQQSLTRLLDDGIDAGTRAAALKDQYDPNAPIQIAQLQTDIRRVLAQGRWELYPADLVVIDEAHMAMSEKPIELMQAYLAKGACILGLSGTPIGMSGAYSDIVVAAKNSELRACGAHVPAKCFSVHEMDVGQIKKEKNGEYSEGSIVKECWNQAIVGYIYEDWKRLNPDGYPTLCAAPGIGESIWVSDMFRNGGVRSEEPLESHLIQKGLRVAHIDCEKVIVNGEVYVNDSKGTVRNQVIEDARKGLFDIVCHCQVIQEGVDWPDLRHLILARPYGSMANYIQSVGRVIRASPGKPHAVIQDHGGNMVRHGSPNADRDWESMFRMTEKDIAEQRKQDIQEGKEKAPIICVKCGTVRLEGARCPACGHQADPKARMIVEKSGKLVEKIFDEFVKPPDPPPIEIKRLESIFFGLRRIHGRSPGEGQVLAIYAKKHDGYPQQEFIDQWRAKREAKLNEYKSRSSI